MIEAFKSLNVINNEDMIVTLGNTGCGKSTMLSSILFGPESLHIVKQGPKKLIEQKPEFQYSTL